jgi:hypothetical protein
MEGRDHSEDLDVVGRIICIGMDLREVGWEVVDWIHMARDRDQWRAPVKTVTNLRAFLHS